MVEHLYFHIPFCHRICPYCGFYKHLPGNAGYGSFVEALVNEVKGASKRWKIKPRTERVRPLSQAYIKSSWSEITTW